MTAEKSSIDVPVETDSEKGDTYTQAEKAHLNINMDPEEKKTFQYSGMNKQELLEHATKPFWVRLRWFIFILFWCAWIGMLATAVYLIVALPRSNTSTQAENKDWWQVGTIYQIYPRSFKDSINGDGIGDIKGIESKLDYFVDLGASIIWLSPIYKSPMRDFGYDVSNFTDVDPLFGTMDDFKALVKEAKARNIKIVMDFVPNHSSDQNEWFLKSVNKEPPYSDFYVWQPSRESDSNGNPIPPNNWVSVFGGSMWEWNEKRQEFYLHQFAVQQPDLNYRNLQVIQEMKNVLKFWMDLGVDGFRMDAVAHMFEDPRLLDEPKSGALDAMKNESAYYNHIYTFGQPGNLEVLAEFRKVLDEYKKDTDGVTRLMMTEAYHSVNTTMTYYGNASHPIAHFPFNFDFISYLHMNFSAHDIFDIVDSWMTQLPKGAWPNWVVGNHDNPRVASRLGVDMVDALNMLVHLLPGTGVSYNGEELGMTDTIISWEETVDPRGCNAGPERYQLFSRDPCRTPMQWDNTTNAGFSAAPVTWLPVNPNYATVNVAVETTEAASHLNVYKALMAARKSEAIQSGNLQYRVVADGEVFAFTRTKGRNGYFVALNIGYKDVTLNATEFGSVPETATVYTRSIGFKNATLNSTISTASFVLPSRQAIVLTFTAAS